MEIKVRTEDCVQYGCLDRCLMAYMRERPQAKKVELVMQLGISDTTARYHMNRLKDEGAMNINITSKPHKGRGRRRRLYEVK